jgi:signal transduction histidine kinase
VDRDIARRAAALVDAGIILASELDLETLLQRIADIAREVLSASYAAVGIIGDAGNLVRFVYSGIDEETAREIGPLPDGRGVLGVLIEEGRPLRLTEISDHPRSYGFPAHHPPMHSFLGVPIVVRGTIFGRLYLTEKEGSDFSKDDERLALTLASQAGVAIENARLLEEVNTRREELAILEERDRISKDLHDGVIQSIYSVGLSLQGSMSLLQREPTQAAERIDAAIAELDNVVRDVRSYIFELQPKSLQASGLSASIRELVRDLEVNTLADAHLDLDEDLADSIGGADRAEIVHVVREVLSNVARHAQAREVWVACSGDEREFVIRISDDGRGFDPGQVERGLGLTNMQDRARRLGGKMEIEPREPSGTNHTLRIPLGRRL